MIPCSHIRSDLIRYLRCCPKTKFSGEGHDLRLGIWMKSGFGDKDFSRCCWTYPHRFKKIAPSEAHFFPVSWGFQVQDFHQVRHVISEIQSSC